MSDPIRKAAVAGQFYPASCRDISDSIESFNDAFQKIDIPDSISDIIPQSDYCTSCRLYLQWVYGKYGIPVFYRKQKPNVSLS